MSNKNLVTCTLIAAGLFAASVPTFANDHADHSRNAPSTTPAREQHDAPGDRFATLAELEQRGTTYGGQFSAPLTKASVSKLQSTNIRVPGINRHGQS